MKQRTRSLTMRNIIGGWLMTAGLCACFVLNLRADTTPVPTNLINKYPYSTAGRIAVDGYFYGSGVAVGPQVILTAGHVIDSNAKPKEARYGSKQSGDKIEWFARYNELDTGPPVPMAFPGEPKILRAAPQGQGKVGRYVVWGDNYEKFPFLSVAHWNRDFACVVFYEQIASQWAPLYSSASEKDLMETTSNKIMVGYPFGQIALQPYPKVTAGKMHRSDPNMWTEFEITTSVQFRPDPQHDFAGLPNHGYSSPGEMVGDIGHSGSPLFSRGYESGGWFQGTTRHLDPPWGLAGIYVWAFPQGLTYSAWGPLVGAIKAGFGRGDLNGIFRAVDSRMTSLVVEANRTATNVVKPSNDDYQTATTLDVSNGSENGTSFWATRQSREPNHYDGVASSRTVWYQWYARDCTAATFETTGATFRTVLAVYEGNRTAYNLVPGKQVKSALARSFGSSVKFQPETGKWYLIAVGGVDYAQGRFTLKYKQAPAVPPTISKFAVSKSNLVTGEKAVVYITANDTDCGIAQVSLRLNGVEIESPELSAPVPNQTVKLSLPFQSHARGRFPLQVIVTDVSGLTATRTLDVELKAPSGSINVFESNPFGGAGLISAPVAVAGSPARGVNSASLAPDEVTQWSVSGSNVAGSLEASEPNVQTGDRTVWWKWQAPKNGYATVTTSKLRFNHTVEVYNGNNLGSLFRLGYSSSDSNGSTVTTFRVQMGHVYQLRVLGRNGTVGDIHLQVKFTPSNIVPAVFPAEVLAAKDDETSIAIGASDPDGDSLQWSIVTPPTHGRVETTVGAIGTVASAFTETINPQPVLYTPDPGYEGMDSFVVVVSDGEANSQARTVTIFVRPKDAPGTRDPSFQPATEGFGYTYPFVEARKVFMGNGLPRLSVPLSGVFQKDHRLAGMGTDGTLLAGGPQFGGGYGGAWIETVDTTADGTVFVGGRFSYAAWPGHESAGVKVKSYTGIAVFPRGINSSDGTATLLGPEAIQLLAPAPTAFAHVFKVSPLADGRILVGGDFQGSQGGRAARFLECFVPGLNPSGERVYGPDPAFHPGVVQGIVRDLKVDDSGRIHVLSDAAPYVFRLLPDGDLDESFVSPAFTAADSPMTPADFVEALPSDSPWADAADNRFHTGFRMGRYEVTNGQYVAFLNAVASTADPSGLYNPSMTRSIHGGIVRQSVGGGLNYAVKAGFLRKPVNFVSQLDAARFINWLSNGAFPSGDTENGAYTLRLELPFRNRGALFFLPSIEEFGGAGYFSTTDDSSWYYPNRSNNSPVAEAPPGGANSANWYDSELEKYAVGTVTDVGSYPNSVSPSGTYDQGGNVSEYLQGYGSQSLEGGGYATGGGWDGGSVFNVEYSRSPEYGVDEGDGTNETGRSAGFRVAALGSLNPVQAMALVRDPVTGIQKLVMGGSFRHVNGIPVPCLARLLANGAVDPAFKPADSISGFSERPQLITAVLPFQSGGVLLGGDFLNASGAIIGRAFWLKSDGSVEPRFAPDFNTGWSVHSLAIDGATGRFIVGGILRPSAGASGFVPVLKYRSGNRPPVLALRGFPTSATIPMGGSFLLGAEASDEDGLIADVRFFVNDQLIGKSVEAPYQALWVVPANAAGVLYNLRVEVVDDQGALTTSATLGFTSRSSDGVMPNSLLTPKMLGAVVGQGASGEVLMRLAEDKSVPIILAESDLSGHRLLHFVATQPEHGVLEGVDGNFTYRPYTNFAGSDSVTIRTFNGMGDEVLQTFSFNVKATPEVPIARNLSVTSVAGKPLVIDLPIFDPDRDEFQGTVRILQSPKHGSLKLRGNQVIYTASKGYSGKDVFTFQGVNATGNSATSSTVIYVQAPALELRALPVPTHVSASDGTLDHGILVSWAAVEKVSRYEIWRERIDQGAGPSLLERVNRVESYLDSTAAAGTNYRYYVSALNDASDASDLSAPDVGFAASEPLNAMIAPLSMSTGKASLSYAVRVLASGPWSVVENLSWVTVTPLVGTGSGRVTVTVAAQSKKSLTRVGVISLAGQIHRITQRGLEPEITVEQLGGTKLKDGISSKSFGSVKVKSLVTKTFTIKNTGTANLTGLAIIRDGAQKTDFIVSGPAKNALAPGSFTNFKVTFKPTAKGDRRAAIHIKNNDANETPFDIKLAGMAK